MSAAGERKREDLKRKDAVAGKAQCGLPRPGVPTCGCPGVPAAHRTAQHATETRARIMRAAERLFAEKGYAAASVLDISNAAEVNRALLYYYFEDKHSLYTALIDEGVAEFKQMLNTALNGPGAFGERLEAFVRGHVALIVERGDHCRMVHRCLLDGNQEEFGLLEKFRGCVSLLEDFFRAGIAAGAFRDLDPEITARTCIGPTFVYSLWQRTEGERFSPDQVADQTTRMLLGGILR